MGFLYCIIYLAVMGLTVFIIGRIFPRKWIKENAFPFRSFSFEKNGKIYEKTGIRKWKPYWPDASVLLHRFFPKRYPKKRLDEADADKIPVLIKESCVAESTHVICGLLGFFCIRIWKRTGGVVVSVVWFMINIPPIIIQRYTRPRLIRALRLAEARAKRQSAIVQPAVQVAEEVSAE